MKLIKNPDQQFVTELKKKIKKNNGFCPCQIERTEDTKCKPCKLLRDTGECVCGLYIQVPDDMEVQDG